MMRSDFDVRYAQYLIFVSQKYELARKVLGDSEKLCERSLSMPSALKFMVHYLAGTAARKMFTDACLSYQAMYAPKYKYREFNRNIPFNALALGKWLDSLPGFTDVLKTQFKVFLDQSKQHLEKAVRFAKTESMCMEFDVSLADAYRDLAETCYLLSEYRVRVSTYKHAPYKAEDEKRKALKKLNAAKAKEQEGIEDSKPEDGRDQWEEQKRDRENLDRCNRLQEAAHYLKAADQVRAAQNEFWDNVTRHNRNHFGRPQQDSTRMRARNLRVCSGGASQLRESSEL